MPMRMLDLDQGTEAGRAAEHDALDRKPAYPPGIILRADLMQETIICAEDYVPGTRTRRIRTPFRDRAAQPADAAVLLDGRHHPIVAEDIGQARGVQRLDRGHADDADREAA